MPIEVTCPSCQAILPLPKNFSGKKVRCSDCEEVVEVPAAKSPVATKAKAMRKPDVVDEERPSKRRRDADDDEEDAPRRKSRRNRDDDDDDRKPGIPKVAIAIAGVAAVAILAASAWFLTRSAVVAPPGVPALNAVAPIANLPAIAANPAANGQMNNFAPVNGQQNGVPIDGWEHEVLPNQPKK